MSGCQIAFSSQPGPEKAREVAGGRGQTGWCLARTNSLARQFRRRQVERPPEHTHPKLAAGYRIAGHRRKQEVSYGTACAVACMGKGTAAHRRHFARKSSLTAGCITRQRQTTAKEGDGRLFCAPDSSHLQTSMHPEFTHHTALPVSLDGTPCLLQYRSRIWAAISAKVQSIHCVP